MLCCAVLHMLQALQRLHDAVDVFLALPSPADDAADAHLLPLSTCIQGVAGLVGVSTGLII
jgi:hypothetical protein